MGEPSPFIPPRPGLSPRHSPRGMGAVIPPAPFGTSAAPPFDPSHYVQPRIGRTPYRGYDGLPPPHSYENSPYPAYGQTLHPQAPQPRSRPTSMYATATPAMSRSSSGGLHPGHAPPAAAGYWEGYGPPHESAYPSGARPRSHSRPQPPAMDFSQPPPSAHAHPRSHSRGLSDDPYLRPVPVPEQFAHLVPPDSSWYNIPGHENAFGQSPVGQPAGYGAYPSPADYGAHYGGYGGGPRPRSRSTHRSERSTPWRGGGYLPPMTPGGFDEPDLYDDYGHRVARPERVRAGDLDTRWMTGKGYGPVLDPLHASIVRATFKINPLLSPPPSDESSTRPYLEWNMLFSSARAHRSDERITQSWMKGRDAPATFPRLSHLRLVSKKFAWFIDVKASDRGNGVTCGDVVDMLSDFFRAFTKAEDYSTRTKVEQDAVREAYWHNRSAQDDEVPGGRLGKGMRRMDFLGMDTMWGGMEVNERYVKERLALHGNRREASCIFVLKCERRLPMTIEETQASRARGVTIEDAEDDDN